MSIDNILLQNKHSKLLLYAKERLDENFLADCGQTQRTIIASKTDDIKVLEWLSEDWEADVRNAVLNNPICTPFIKNKVINYFYKRYKIPTYIDQFSKNKQKLYLITPCARELNLIFILHSIEQNIKNFNVTWYICFDADVDEISDQTKNMLDSRPYINYFFVQNPDSNSGNAQRNYILDNLKIQENVLVYFLDDDNIIHHNFDNLQYMLEKSINFYIWQQDRYCWNNTFDDLKNGYTSWIDTAQWSTTLESIGKHRWEPINDYGADTTFFGKIWNGNLEKTKLIEIKLCYYNYLTGVDYGLQFRRLKRLELELELSNKKESVKNFNFPSDASLVYND